MAALVFSRVNEPHDLSPLDSLVLLVLVGIWCTLVYYGERFFDGRCSCDDDERGDR